MHYRQPNNPTRFQNASKNNNGLIQVKFIQYYSNKSMISEHDRYIHFEKIETFL